MTSPPPIALISSLPTMGIIGLVLLVIGLSLTLWGEYVNRRILVLVGKPMASAGFLWIALSSESAFTGVYGPAVMIGLGLSALGDVLLLNASDRGLLFGLSAFLLAHLGFAVACAFTGCDLGAAAKVGFLAWVSGAWAYRFFSSSMAPELRGPSIAYIVVIGVMMACTLGKAWPTGDLTLGLAAICFWFSDISVARARFTQAGFTNRLWGLPLYYLAQALFALTLHAPPQL